MSNTKRPKFYGQTAAYARKEASLTKKRADLAQKRNALLVAFKADPTNMRLREKYECADIKWEEAFYACVRHERRYSEYL